MRRTEFDVVVFGATSFVGQILVRYLAAQFGTAGRAGPRPLRWAIAGRSPSKLQALLADLGADDRAVPWLVADSSDEQALRTMARRTRLVVSTVGPYALHGDALVKVCAESGTDYCDLTGEAHWVRKMIAAHEAAAIASGARIVHCCGFDSIPSDLGVWYLQQQAKRRFGGPCVDVSMRVKAMRGGASGGTIASMLNIIREATRDREVRRAYADPYSLCIGAHVGKPAGARQRNLRGPAFDRDFGVWVAPFVMAAINARIVLRSAALAGDAYGENFRYDEAMMMGPDGGGRLRATGFSAGLGVFVAGAAIAPTRWLMERTILPAPGTGPSLSAQERGFWDYRFIGKTASGQSLHVQVTGDRDPGYGSTAKMLGEAAACLALDVPRRSVGGGFWTPAASMASRLVARLTQHAGVRFEVLG